MRRIIGSVLVVAAVLVGTAACGGSDDSSKSGSATTAAASGGSSGDSTGAPGNSDVDKLCNLVDQIIDAAKAKDAEKLKQLGEEAKTAATNATKSIISNPASAKRFGECSSKLTSALSEAGITPSGLGG